MRRNARASVVAVCLFTASYLAGCSGQDPSPFGGNGGAQSLGGTASLGGQASGSGGAAAGGKVNTGGNVGLGGNATTGGSVAVGGSATTGGSVAVGGSATIGGSVAVGGNATTGGTPNVGGSSSSTGGNVTAGGTTAGGVSTGGKAAGGASTGGATTTAIGGSSTTGGSSNVGGSSTGGGATGGLTSTGGSATGGVSTGGSATGGKPSTGGTATGGSATGGNSSVGGATGTPGCNGNATPATSLSNGYLNIAVTLAKGGTEARTYTLDLPTGYDGKTPVPVMFAYHGTSSDALQFLGQGYGNVRAGANKRVLLVGPQGLTRGGYVGWIDNSGSGSVDGINPNDIDFFDALIAQLKAKYCIDASRIFSMGHSAGGFISNVLGCIRGNVLRGIGPFAGGGPDEGGGVTCTGKVAAFIGHNPKEGDATECAYAGGCQWNVLWAETGWPTTQYWTTKDACGSIGAMPTAAFCSDPPTTPVSNPATCCKAYTGCSANYPVTLCLYDHYDQWDGPHAFPESWGAKAVTDFFLALPRVQ